MLQSHRSQSPRAPVTLLAHLIAGSGALLMLPCLDSKVGTLRPTLHIPTALCQSEYAPLQTLGWAQRRAIGLNLQPLCAEGDCAQVNVLESNEEPMGWKGGAYSVHSVS
ncbi:hypothetical protein TSTA_032620 [Talaromyces stipitatus ATCC 10500]|uniref:Uncharacterized protein n=1 Tax=Talaromyces stipitatus (strain ATCC 10500 / CBS 375.48 / QM 6759 / NRRL 1006) TaxID=441959 RepID=B8M846_TALSN|nr:uncharacterized protein TSTA_032620 [Talaromyces stipitatus ATCC 10500]EED20008.1 hypothetical protein TSTA_032620 [Talaromyces stipitatus ATCC 10500]